MVPNVCSGSRRKMRAVEIRSSIEKSESNEARICQTYGGMV
jgi:hypothetical protein